jgi:hypothetical protein
MSADITKLLMVSFDPTLERLIFGRLTGFDTGQKTTNEVEAGTKMTPTTFLSRNNYKHPP